MSNARPRDKKVHDSNGDSIRVPIGIFEIDADSYELELSWIELLQIVISPYLWDSVLCKSLLKEIPGGEFQSFFLSHEDSVTFQGNYFGSKNILSCICFEKVFIVLTYS